VVVGLRQLRRCRCWAASARELPGEGVRHEYHNSRQNKAPVPGAGLELPLEQCWPVRVNPETAAEQALRGSGGSGSLAPSDPVMRSL